MFERVIHLHRLGESKLAEHGTLFFLRRRFGHEFKGGGRAEADGFRINGLASPDDVAPAFAQLCEHLARGDERPVISRSCGSNIIIAQAYAILLLAVSALLMLVLQLSLQARIAILIVDLAAYILLRRTLGDWLQRHFFMSLAFRDATIHSVNQVKPKGLERRPVFFVRTVVMQAEESAGSLTTPSSGRRAHMSGGESSPRAPAAADG
jgi:hypothetical protein